MNRSATVAIARCPSYGEIDLADSLTLVCEKAHMPDVSGKTVLVKPNILSDAPPEKAITTRWEVVQAVIRMLFSRGAHKVLVGDSPGIHGPSFVPKSSKIAQVCVQEGAVWCEFARDPVLHTIPGTYGLKLPLPNVLDEVDLLFSVAKMKTHQLMYSTGSVKNLFGMVIGLHKSSCHMMYPTRESFARMLGGLYAVVKPDFGITDAIVSMEGAGPAGGIPRFTGLLMASADLSALDAAQSIIMGYDPMSIPLTKELHDRKLTMWREIQEISYPLLDAALLVIPDYKRIQQQPKTRLFSSLIGPLFTKHLKLRHQRQEPKPLFDRTKCVGCGQCVRICPGHALTLDTDRKIVADYDACIRCYCCHEVCPADAIAIEQREQGR